MMGPALTDLLSGALDNPDIVTLISVSLASILIIFRHSSNIRRMLSGAGVTSIGTISSTGR